MAEIKQPLYSFAAQGKVGPIWYTHHAGADYGAFVMPRKPRPPTIAQKAHRDDFRQGAATWHLLPDPIKPIYRWVAANTRCYHRKDCKPTRWSPYAKFMQDWLIDIPDEIKVMGLAAIIGYLLLKYAWVIALL